MTDLMRYRFKQKTFVVTGAAQGIGESIARLLVREGAFVYGLDMQVDRLKLLATKVNRDGTVFDPIEVDIANQQQVDEVIGLIERKRPIDGLVNAAGILSTCSFVETTTENWLATFNINVHGTFFISRSVARRMIQRAAGAIVTIASNASATPRVDMSAYCASKAAVAMFTKCIGLELADYGIRCNIVSPGSTNTSMLNTYSGDPDKKNIKLIEGDQKRFRLGIPLKKIAEPEDVAKAVAFLLSEDASHITLHDLVVDGGATF